MGDKPVQIAIDGPSGAGKSTISRAAAQALGFTYIDTGAMYRAIGLAVMRAGVDPLNEKAVSALLPGIKISLSAGGDQRVDLGGEDVTDAIRASAVSDSASKVSSLPPVRAFLLGVQRQTAGAGSVVMDGRDIGTVILPDATVKIFLTATPEDRAMRRFEELRARGEELPYERVLSDIRERDARDSGRETAPLRPADDAVILETTGFPLEKSIALVLGIIRERLGLV